MLPVLRADGLAALGGADSSLVGAFGRSDDGAAADAVEVSEEVCGETEVAGCASG